MYVASYSINIWHFVTRNSYVHVFSDYMFSVMHSSITLKVCCIIFSLRMERFVKFSLSFATNLSIFSLPKFFSIQ